MDKFLDFLKIESKEILEKSLLNKMFYGDVFEKYKQDNDNDSIIIDWIGAEADVFEKIDLYENISETLKRIKRLQSKGKYEYIHDSYFHLIKSLYNFGDKKAFEHSISEFLLFIDNIKYVSQSSYFEKRISELFVSLYLNFLDNSAKKENLLEMFYRFVLQSSYLDINSIYTMLSMEYQNESKAQQYYKILEVVSDRIQNQKIEILDKIQLENIMIMATEENLIDEAFKIADKLNQEYGYSPNIEFVRVRKILNEYMDSKITKDEAEKKVNEILDFIKSYSSNLSDEENRYIYFLAKLELIKTFGEDEKISNLIEEIESFLEKDNVECELCMIILLECYVLTNDVDKFKKVYQKVKNSEKLSQHKDIMDFIDFLNDEIS
ncbi:MAG: hypothetical protein GXO22_07045 [Aquificae bacterium]|nr:hypothetical protein [Aquificota bacterium]